MADIQFVGIENIDNEDADKINEIAKKELEFADRELKGINNIKIHLKRHKIGGRVKWSAHLFIDWPSKKIIDVEGVGWDIIKAVHEVITKAKNHINHLLKKETSYKKPYY